MKFFTTAGGNLCIQLENEADRQEVRDMLEHCGGDDVSFMAELLEHTGWEGNGRLMLLHPEDVAALTDAPIVTDGRDILDDGTVVAWGNVWWYPNYMVSHFGQVLLDKSEVIFMFAPAVQESDAACAVAA